MKDILSEYLKKLEDRVDFEHQSRVRGAYERIFAFEEVDELPFVYVDFESRAQDRDWPTFPYNDAFRDPAKMLLNQLRGIFFALQVKNYRALNIRCNYGTVILPSIMGGSYQLTKTSMPWTHHLSSRAEIRRIVRAGVPDVKTGLGKTCFDTANYYREILANYPKLKRAISIYHPDLQGPFDVAHLLWGQDIFLALYDDPDLVHSLLSLIVETYKEFMYKWKSIVSEGNSFTTHWQFYIKGEIMLRDDAPVMLSKKQCEEFVKPYDEVLLREFGGCIHFCGKGDQFISSMCTSDNLQGINSSQPELNNIELLLNSTQNNRVVLLGLPERFLNNNIKTGVVVIKKMIREGDVPSQRSSVYSP